MIGYLFLMYITQYLRSDVMVFKVLFEIPDGIEIFFIFTGKKDPCCSGCVKIMDRFLAIQLPGLLSKVITSVRTPDIVDLIHLAII